MSRYIKILNVKRIPVTVEKWTKTRKFLLSEKGRWGPRWLQKLVLRAATNLGMIQHEKSCLTETTVDVQQIDTRDTVIGGKIFNMAAPFLEDGYRVSDLFLLCSPDFINQIMADIHYRHSIQIGYADKPPAIYGFDVVVVNHIDGAAIIPKDNVRKAFK